MLQVTCPHCGNTAKASDQFAGRKTKCRGCGNLLRIPQAQPRNATKSDVPIIKFFEIKKTLLGKYIASYKCPRCESPLRSSEQELLRGDDICPHCDERFRVAENAAAEIQSRLQEKQEEKQRKRQERHAARVQAKRDADAKFSKTQHARNDSRKARLADDFAFLEQAREQILENKRERERRRELYEAQQTRKNDGTTICPFCKERILAGAVKCKHCGSNLEAAQKSNSTAFWLGLLLGPAGLWYKGHWPAGFAWLAITLLLGVASGGLLLPFLWIGMAVHASSVKPRG